MNFLLSVSPSKEMGARTRQRKKISDLIGFDRPLLYRLSYEASREQVVSDNGGNCGNVNMKGTNECCTSST